MGDRNSISDLSVIAEKICLLETRIAELTDKVSRLEAGVPVKIDSEPGTGADPISLLEPREELGEWLSKGALLQKMAAVCFILVFALLLRTVTDYGYINVTAGSFLGLAYVSILALIGCVFYVTGRQMANVFSISGFLLLFTIVIEGHSRFDTIPVGVAYAILITALVTSAVVGIKYRVAKLLWVSMIGVTIAGLVLGFPKVIFPLSGLLFLIANIVAFIASDRSISGKLKWPVTLLTLLYMALWSFKAFAPLDRGEPVPIDVYPEWLGPFLVAFAGLYLFFYVKRYFKEARLTVYDAVIPSLNVLLLFLVGLVVVKSYWQQSWLMGLFTLAMAFGHFALGWRLLTKDPVAMVGVGGAFVAGAMAMALGMPVVVGNVAWAIPFWALTAYWFARLSARGGSGFIRGLSYFYPLFALFTGLGLDIYDPGHQISLPASLAAAASLALFGLLQFSWCRDNPPPADSLLAGLDSRDHSAVVLLLVALTGMYLLFSTVIDSVASMVLADPANTMKCGRSIIINIGAIFLLAMAGWRHDRELAWIAVSLAVVGCLKVFLADLFGTGGIPLVLSVLSFGLVAMLGSVVMGRWNKGAGINPA